MVTSKVTNTNKTFRHKGRSEHMHNTRQQVQRNGFEINLAFIVDIVYVALLEQSSQINIIPIYLHQDYNYRQYGK